MNCLKEKAINYRKSGYSYGIISNKLNISKSTLSGWLKNVSYSPNNETLDTINNGKKKSIEYKQVKRIKDTLKIKKSAKKEIGKISKRDLLILGIGIYLGEGTKSNEHVRMINSDPRIIRISIRWFQEICNLKIENFSPSIHLYPDNNIKEATSYWSKITNIPEYQFRKPQIDLRLNKLKKKKNKLPYGTLHIQIKSCGKKEFGRNLHRRIMGWIETL